MLAWCCILLKTVTVQYRRDVGVGLVSQNTMKRDCVADVCQLAIFVVCQFCCLWSRAFLRLAYHAWHQLFHLLNNTADLLMGFGQNQAASVIIDYMSWCSRVVICLMRWR